MRRRLLEVLGVIGVILAVIVLLKVAPAGSATQAPGSKTAWAAGPPGHLDGRFSDAAAAAPAKCANKEQFTDRRARGTGPAACGDPEAKPASGGRHRTRHVAGAYNAVFQSIKHTGKRSIGSSSIRLTDAFRR